MKCHLCETRKPRRFCPGVRAEICAPCCGQEREVSVYCPLDCEYLLDAREHEKLTELKPEQVPNADIRVTEEFLNANDQLTAFLSRALLIAALQAPGAVDRDILAALESLIKTYRTRQSGLIYESRPDNMVAGMIHHGVQTQLEQYQQALQQQTGIRTLRDTDVLGVLVFIQRFALHWDNGRPRGRALISFLLKRHPIDQPPQQSLIAG